MRGLLEVRGLRVTFPGWEGAVKAVDGVSFGLEKGETLGLVGESGCGKTMTALALLRLIPPPGMIAGGEIFFEGRDLLAWPEEEMRRIRGKKIAMIFQEPMTSLNPVFTVGDQIEETIRAHERVGRSSARERALRLLAEVNIPAPAERLSAYPHQLSGGMRQRVMIAIALSCRPLILIADEPTTALDVTVQAQILKLLSRLRRELDMALLLVTHDLGVVAQETARVAVMYLGRIVEAAATRDLFARPLHPYTAALMRSIPRLGETKRRLAAIPGNVPDPLQRPPGCSFHPRCPLAEPVCRREEPVLIEFLPGHAAACHVAQRECHGRI
ncbi:MAG: ABC transporter ATP-binding protein [Candidatus Aureabacteria bacterium]|nr:ABC transporter ATP-binding protein [Candidatus Auribacterota bacterium]